MSEYTPSMDMIRRAYVSVNGARAMYSRAADDDRALVGRNFDRALAAHDAEVILEYVKRAKPEPIHIDNIDGVKAGDWFRAHDAATREDVLVEVADRADAVAAEWARRSHVQASNALTLFAESLRPGIDADTPQGRSETGQRGVHPTNAGTSDPDVLRGQQAAGSAHDDEQPRTWYRVTRDVPASDWSFWSSAPLMESHDALIKRVAPLTMTTTEMAARNTKARKDAHDIDVDHAVALERLAIVTYLQRRQSKHYAEFDKWGDPSEQERGIAYDMAWQEVQNGAHNRGAGK